MRLGFSNEMEFGYTQSIHKMFQKNKRGVYCLGLYGMGGLGKSTMCKELCNYLGPSLFHRSCTLDIGSKKGSKFKRHIKILESYKYLSKEQISKFDKYQVSYSLKYPRVESRIE